jgi:putative addiction module CopG family antidote
MSIKLPPDVEASIRQRVQRGRFPDEGEVMREAIRLLDERELQLDALRAKIRVDLDELDRGEGVEMTPGAVGRDRSRGRRVAPSRREARTRCLPVGGLKSLRRGRGKS